MASTWIGQKARASIVHVFAECPDGLGWAAVADWASLYDMKLGERVRLSEENGDVCQLDVRRAERVLFCPDGAVKYGGKRIGLWRLDDEMSRRLNSSVRVVSMNPESVLCDNSVDI